MSHRATSRIFSMFLSVALMTGTSIALGQVTSSTTAGDTPKDSSFQIQGEYLTPESGGPRKGVQVVALGKGTYRIVIYSGGLPGAGWDRKPPQIMEEADSDDVTHLIESLGAKKVQRQSPTLGLVPPEGAIFLFDGTEESLKNHWRPGAKRTEAGDLLAGATSQMLFRDCLVHLEFQTPYMPQARGQGRGNSGVYLQGRYEVQILDSFGLPGLNNEAGAIYAIHAPMVNMCFPPMSWQTYDIEFTAPRFDHEGKKVSNAKMTVRHNGVIVQQDVEIPGPTRAAPFNETPDDGPLYLQDHNNPVSFRNVWVVPRDADREALRPRIPGYERFLAHGDRNIEAGRLLLGELGCLRCHAADAEIQASLNLREAPRLTEVGQRINPSWMKEFLSSPHVSRPGTLMPDLFAGWSEEDRDHASLALVHYLADETPFPYFPPNPRKWTEGANLFHTIGCTACHPPQDGTAVPDSTSVPLTGLNRKYNLNSLASFLQKPHQTRPSGRMPSLNLTDNESASLAHFLLRNGDVELIPNMHFKVYEGQWDKLPDFDTMTPVLEGECYGFDLSKAGRSQHFGMRFEGFMARPRQLTVEMGLGSDDGSRVTINHVLAVENDGVHPYHVIWKTVRFEDLPVIPVRVDFFQNEGGMELSVEIKQGNAPAIDLASLISLRPEDVRSGKEPGAKQQGDTPGVFVRDPELARQGLELFETLGCANCHERKEGDHRVGSLLRAPDLNQLNLAQGCLSATPVPLNGKAKYPDFHLSTGQRRDLIAALQALATTKQATPQERIERTLITLNCYACHERERTGGPETARNHFFTSTEKEMGDEGRLPPILTGVGDKLQDQWLAKVLDSGARNRPYMLTRMPAFGAKNVGTLQADLVAVDRRNEASPVEFDEPLHRTKSAGRRLVGNGALGCIKCHTFGNHPSTGIQAVSLTEMTGRIREDWFRRYLIDPARYRPGTRMPTGFPNGQAVVRDLYNGNPDLQTAAIWTYLTDGDKAGIPDGLIAGTIELIPKDEPILYRNFLEESSPGSFAIGYPEQIHVIWDPQELSLRRAWQGRFIDASKHWTGRGSGFQGPLGDNIISLDAGFPFALLESSDSPWPNLQIRETPEYRFTGYSIDEKGRPTFRYQTPFGTVTDFPEPVAKTSNEGILRRHLTIHSDSNVNNLYFRAAVAQKIVPVEGGFLVDDSFRLRFTGGGAPFIRENGNRKELVIPIPCSGRSEFAEEVVW